MEQLQLALGGGLVGLGDFQQRFDEAGLVDLVFDTFAQTGVGRLIGWLVKVLAEHPTQRRELVEETGLEAEHWRPVIEMIPSPGFCTERVHVYLATGLREVGRPEAEHEEADMEVASIPFACSSR